MRKKDEKNLLNIVKAVYPMLLYYVIIQLTAFVFVFAYLLAKRNFSLSDVVNTVNGLSLWISFFAAIITLPIILIIKNTDRKNQKAMGVKGYRSVNPLLYILIIPFALTYMYAANFFVQILEILIPFVAHTYDKTADTIFSSNIVVQVLYGIIVGPIVEELIFRGLLYARLKRMFGHMIAAVATGLLFGFFHFNLAQGIYAFVFSFAVIYVYEKFKTIVAPIIFHMISNGVGVLVTFAFKDYNSQSGVTANALKGPESLVTYLCLFAVSAIIAGIFAFCIGKCVNPQKR